MSGCIAIIDDDEDDRILFGEALQSLGLSYALREYSCGESFFKDIVLSSNGLPDIVFMDVNMPKADGFTILDMIKQTEGLKNIHVIMFSTSTSPAVVKLAKMKHANGFTTKPMDYDDLKATIRSVIQNFTVTKAQESFIEIV